jgi:hypothetical protein
MTSFTMPWAFVMSYHHHDQTMIIQCSNSFQSMFDFNAEHVTLNQEDITKCVHMYDYRKLNYFSSAPLESTFDTLIRIRLTAQGPYMRTIAVCSQTHTGFSCVHLMEIDVIRMRHTMKMSNPLAHMHLDIMDGQWIKAMQLQDQIQKFKVHLTHLMDKT